MDDPNDTTGGGHGPPKEGSGGNPPTGAAPPSRARLVAYAGGSAALLGGVASAVPGAPPVVGALLLLAGAVAVAAAVWVRGRGPALGEEENDTFAADARLHLLTNLLLVAIFVFLLVEVLAAFAGAGAFLVFGAAAGWFVRLYGVLVGLMILAVAAVADLGLARSSREPLGPRQARSAGIALSVAALFGVAGFVTSLGVLPANPDRAPFVLTATAAGLFYAARLHAGLPDLRKTIDWLEREERVRATGLPRKIVLALGTTAGLLVLASIGTGAFGLHDVSILAIALAMLSVLLATFSLGVTRVVAKLEEGLDDIATVRHKRKLTLNSLGISLILVGVALTVATLLAALAQAGGVALFASLLTVFVGYYPIFIAVAMIPLLATCFLRLNVASDVPYTDRAKAVTILGAGSTVVLVFFGTFIGSGLAQGTGIAIENAVLLMSGAAISLVAFVHARGQLPGVFRLAHEQIKSSESADEGVKERIQRQMLATYVISLVFVLSFIGLLSATALGVVDVESNVVTDTAFFVYVILGIVLLGLVLLRYFQGVNMDPAWRKKDQQDIGKRRLTTQELNRYLILGLSVVLATGLAATGVMVQMGIVRALGPLALEPRFATDFYVFAILVGLGPYGWYYNREQARIRAIDGKFPEFLRDLAESQRSGMTLTEAVITASKGNYGALTPEIRKMAAQIEWGVPFGDALERFSKRVRTPLIERTVSLVTQAGEAGGNVVDVLTAAADDSREIQQIVKERTNSMAMYVYIIYIAFGVFLTVIGVLNAQFIPEVSKAVQGAKGATVGGITFRPFDEQAFKTLFFHASIIQGLGGGFVAGVMQGGKPIMGLKHAFILVLAGYLIFRFVIGG